MSEGFLLGCSFIPNRAEDQVLSQVGFVNAHVDQTFDTVMHLTQELAAYRVPNLSFDISLDALPPFNIRDPGEPPDTDPVELGAVAALPTSPGNAVAPPRAQPGFALPTPPPDAPTPTFAAPPGTYFPAFPADVPLANPPIPVYGDHTNDIPIPVPRPITLPPDPNVDLSGIHFQGVRPTFDFEPPDPAAYVYVEEAYSPLLVDQIKAKLLLMMNGQSGIPASIEIQIWSREAEREEEQATRAEQEVMATWASRGFGMPHGQINAELASTRQNNQNQRNSKSRDVAIRTQDVLLEQLKLAIAQGVALEELWVRVWTSAQDRKLQAVKISADIAVSIFNARVGMVQAEADVYKADVEVYKGLIEAELAKLQVYHEELEARRLIGTLNQQDVDLYKARLEAVDTNTRIFVAEVQARNGILDGERLKLEQQKMRIDKELAKLQASQLQLDAWKSLLQGESLKQDAWKTRAEIYTAQVGAWGTAYNADIERMRADVAVIEAISQRFIALVQAATASVNYEKTKADVTIASNEAKTRLYEAKVAGDSAFNTALIQKFKSISDALRDQKDLAIKNGEINVQNILEASKTVEQAIATATQVLAQVLSGFASAVNVGAHISDSANSSFSCNTSLSQTLDPPTP